MDPRESTVHAMQPDPMYPNPVFWIRVQYSDYEKMNQHHGITD
jgi:hypothetical protein